MDKEVVEVVKAIPKKKSRIIELADGSDDDEITIKGDTEIEVDTNILESGEESKTAEAELGKRLCLIKN